MLVTALPVVPNYQRRSCFDRELPLRIPEVLLASAVTTAVAVEVVAAERDERSLATRPDLLAAQTHLAMTIIWYCQNALDIDFSIFARWYDVQE
jgi:hypothetical protein